MATLTLANISLDVQISICMYLHPSDILSLRKTCKALQLSTQQRAVWVDALHRVCIDNSLFLPTFPISNMSDMEIEKAAMGPRRWIELCGAYEKQHLNDPDARLRPRTTRIINDSFATKVDYTNTEFFIVPGGRYLVKSSPKDLSVLDLGYTASADCKLIASVRLDGESSNKCLVQATPDGMGLVILLYNKKQKSVYEIYPRIETPHLTRIAHVDFESTMNFRVYLLPEKVIWYESHWYQKRIDFKVWDYRFPLNRLINFSLDVYGVAAFATKTAIIVVCEEAVLIWAIPPLSSQPPDFFDHNPIQVHMPPPLITVPFPDGPAPKRHTSIRTTLSSWYFSSSQPFYFDTVSQDEDEDLPSHKFQIIVEPDLSTASIHAINTSVLTMEDHYYLSLEDFRICEDTLVSCWVNNYYSLHEYQSGVYTGLTSPDPAHGISHGGPSGEMLLPDIGHSYLLYACPASGRFVRLDDSNSVAVLDLF